MGRRILVAHIFTNNILLKYLLCALYFVSKALDCLHNEIMLHNMLAMFMMQAMMMIPRLPSNDPHWELYAGCVVHNSALEAATQQTGAYVFTIVPISIISLNASGCIYFIKLLEIFSKPTDFMLKNMFDISSILFSAILRNSSSIIPSNKIFCSLDSIRILYLNHNSFEGNIPACVGNLTNLINLGYILKHLH